MSSLLSRIFGGRARDRIAQAEAVLGVIERLVDGAKDLKEAQSRIAEGAERGDLDDVISWAQKRDSRVKDFLQGG